ncbi:natural killer cell receptor 2B4 isoform X2 [Suricata suricatta]|uniref:natural killer cell receptor 2B4 isoform X2 n=1 Tax=Suricata suricatta TaxID=37032 RepID=UPI00115556A1|nr:natural killer cell receptor 2B4 isoform X2 [Suricata suricatta]
MLGPALLLTLLFLKGHQGQGTVTEKCYSERLLMAPEGLGQQEQAGRGVGEFLDSAEHVVGLSGACLELHPPRIQTSNIYSVEWKELVGTPFKVSSILKWKYNSPCCKYEDWTLNHINKKFNFITTNFSLIIQAAHQRDSGLYIFEVTDESGDVECHKFRVSVFDHVGKLHIQEEQKELDGGRCQVTLSCSIISGGNVSYDWYREGMLIQTPRNLSKLEDQIDANSSHTYTCNVSNLVSWVSHTFTQHCPSDVKHSMREFLLSLVVIVVCLITLFLGSLIGLCVWRRKRKQSQASAEEFLTVYEDVNNVQITTNQVRCPRARGPSSRAWEMLLRRMATRSRDISALSEGSAAFPSVFPSSLLALAVEEKQKTRENLRRMEPDNPPAGGRMQPLLRQGAPRPHFRPVPAAGLSPGENPAFSYFVPGHQFSCPCKSKFTLLGPLIVAQAAEDASRSSQSLRAW